MEAIDLRIVRKNSLSPLGKKLRPRPLLTLREGDSSIMRKTLHGGFLSVLAICFASCMMLWSVFDFAVNNKNVIKATTLNFEAQENDVTLGDYSAEIKVVGSFSDCGGTFVSSFNQEGFTPSADGEETFDCFDIIDISGCYCRWDCRSCGISSSDMEINLVVDTEGQFIKTIYYNTSYPHYDEGSSFNVDGLIFEADENILTLDTTITIFRTLYVRYSYVNLITQLVDYEYSPEFTGIMASVLSDEITKSAAPDTELQIDLLFELSSFRYEITESQNQGALSFLAQLTALFSLSITIMGVMFIGLDRCNDIILRRIRLKRVGLKYSYSKFEIERFRELYTMIHNEKKKEIEMKNYKNPNRVVTSGGENDDKIQKLENNFVGDLDDNDVKGKLQSVLETKKEDIVDVDLGYVKNTKEKSVELKNVDSDSNLLTEGSDSDSDNDSV